MRHTNKTALQLLEWPIPKCIARLKMMNMGGLICCKRFYCNKCNPIHAWFQLKEVENCLMVSVFMRSSWCVYKKKKFRARWANTLLVFVSAHIVFEPAVNRKWIINKTHDRYMKQTISISNIKSMSLTRIHSDAFYYIVMAAFASFRCKWKIMHSNQVECVRHENTIYIFGRVNVKITNIYTIFGWTVFDTRKIDGITHWAALRTIELNCGNSRWTVEITFNDIQNDYSFSNDWYN